jgi:hypothetical protein
LNGTPRNGKQCFLRGNEKRGHKMLLGIIHTAHTIQLSARAFFSDSQRKRNAGNGENSWDSKDTVTDALGSIEALLWYVNYDCLNSRRYCG